MTSKTPEPPPKSKPVDNSRPDSRDSRRAAALRANLKRRKGAEDRGEGG